MEEETRTVLPAVALRGRTVLPSTVIHFDINRVRSVRAVENAMLKDQKVFLVTQRDSTVEEPTQDDLYQIGTVALIRQVVRLNPGSLRIVAESQERAELLDLTETERLLMAEVAVLEETDDTAEDPLQQEAMVRNLKEFFEDYCSGNRQVSKDLQRQILEIQDLKKLVDQICVNLSVPYEKQQRLLEAVSLSERYDLLSAMLANEAAVQKIRAQLQADVKARIDKNQKEYILREELKLIREELGEDNTQSELQRYREQTDALKAPAVVKNTLREEIRRLENVVGNPSESGVIRGYIETLLGLPWDKKSRDNRDLKKARAVLEADHYGLEQVKERILEYLAVRLATKKGEAPILCLVGPPGTGKTSISKSVAKALNKTFVRISLGGVRDEAEIRGHRRTYVGAMPGRIAQGLHQAKVRNPLMLLDEIDKTSSDYKGDIASALLEVLDSAENYAFEDHYVEVPIDLSDVLFIATANDVQNIPRPLLDRMELIEINSYTDNEKLHIAKEHLVPRQISANGLKKDKIVLEDGALEEIISAYTKEAGVRSLERQIGRICRKAALQKEEEKGIKETVICVTKETLKDYLGKPKYHVNPANPEPEIGIVRGLAWTSVGGDTLEIEVNVMPGKGEFLLTGQLGDVMKESAQTGISYLRAAAGKWNIPEDFFGKHDIHIHIPEGAVPKDGPSAGITMATAMLSALTEIPVRSDLAMTGEITLRGRVLPIGGLKEKLLAARKAGIKMVLVPDKNRPDVEELDAEVTQKLDIRFVNNMDQVLEYALVRK